MKEVDKALGDRIHAIERSKPFKSAFARDQKKN